MQSVDTEIDRLYSLPPEQFVSAREELAKRLRTEGNRDAAEGVKRLRKPTVTAWVANGLARREKMNVRALVTAGERMRSAQAALLKGAPASDVQAAAESERKAVLSLVAAARAILSEHGRPTGEQTLDRIAETLHAAALDPGNAELLQAGRLTGDLEASGFGFEVLGPVAPHAKRASRRERERREQRVRRLEEARRAVADARAQLRDAERELAAAEQRAAEARATVARAKRVLEGAERALERARS